jgi:tetratricopeptide (TPR) repeat protein
MEPAANPGLLEESIVLLNTAFEAEEIKVDPEAWIIKGQLFNEIAKSEMNKKIVDNSYDIPNPNASIVAFESFKKAIDLAIKKFHTKDALAGIRESEDYLNNNGIFFFQEQKYNEAFKYFVASLKAHDVLKANKMDSRLDDAAAKSDQQFYTGVCGYYGDNQNDAIPYFETLFKAGNAQPLVYVALFTLNSDTNIDKAMTYLNEGKKLYPDDNEILFAEINYYIKANKLDELVSKLKYAIEKEPDNVSVYNALGNVYDQLNQKERGEGNSAKADEYFNSAYDIFSQATTKDPKNFDASYSLGALYYNKAASMVGKLNEVSNDFSSAGTKKYNAIKEEMDGYFKQALPYFLNAEALNPKDLNTMIAIKEIYARQGNLEKSNDYKLKMDALGGGN